MIYRVHQVDEELRIALSLQAGAALGLCDGAAVELTAVDLNALRRAPLRNVGRD